MTKFIDAYRQAPPEMKRSAIYLVGGATILLLIIIGGKWYSFHNEEEARAREIAAGPRARVAHAQRAPGERTLELVGEARPYTSITVYGKVSGYIKQILVDKGDVVKKGQLLAILESPELDQDTQSAKADAVNKRAIADRMIKLRARNLVSQQEEEQAVSDADVASAHYKSLAAQKDYELMRAPFDGVITARYADPGALVQDAQSSQASALPLVTLSQVDQLRIYAYIDQRDAAFAEVGDAAEIAVTERPNFALQGKVTRLAGQLDAKTRMMLAEVDVANKDGAVVPGSFVEVKIKIKVTPAIQVPVGALMVREGKTMVAILSSDNHVHFSEVQIADNDGTNLRLHSGVKEGEIVALYLSSSIANGSLVRPVT